ncbi:MAG: hypothetical protein ACR2L6_08480 [Gemmatimonadaceae bacterium]
MIAMIVGTGLALLALGYVLYPLLVGSTPRVRPGVMLCPKCGGRTEADASFCSSCGGPLVVP